MQQTSSEMLQCLLKDFSTVARLIHFAAWVLLSKSRAPLHCGVFFPSVTAESVRVQWSSRHQLLSKWMLGREGRGVLFVSPLATPPASHVVPAAAPASLCLPVWIQYVHISWISNNDTASPIFCHVITPSPSCLSSSLRLFTLTAGNLASLIHSLYAAFFIRHRLNSGNPTTLLWFPTDALKYYSLLLLIILKNVSVLFSFNILWCAFFSPLIWLSFLGSVVMRTTLSPPLSLSLSHSFLFGSNKNNCLEAQFTYALPVICHSSVRICRKLLRMNKMFDLWYHQAIHHGAAETRVTNLLWIVFLL